jgi:undecaprenyl phosphate-alpha-L-ara4N flippase subunit ArnE
MKEALMLSLAIIFAAIGDILLSLGMRRTGAVTLRSVRDIHSTIYSIMINRLILAGIFCMAIHLSAYITVLAWEDVSVANPLTALSYVIATGYAALCIREKVAPARWVGVFLITTGAMLVGFSS